MNKLFLPLICILGAIVCKGQNVQTATNGLYYNPTSGTAARTVGLGGTLTQNTTVDLGSTFTFGIKKSSTNYLNILNNGNVGIGNSSPSAMFHLGAGTSSNAPLKFTSGTNLTTPSSGAMEFDGTNLFFTPSSTRKQLAFSDLSNATYTSGINFLNPNSGASESVAMSFGQSTAALTTMSLYYGNTGNAVFGGNTSNFIANSGSTGGMHLTVVPDAPLSFSTALTKRMTILGNGKIGIGFENPSEKLSVYNGNLSICSDGWLNTSMGAVKFAYINSPYAWAGISGITNGGGVDQLDLAFYTAYGSASEKMRIMSSSGYVGIGTSTPQAKLDVNGNIFSNGKIVIGTTDPAQYGSYALAVNGDAIFNRVKVKLYGSWPDFVFEDGYQLPELSVVEAFIKKYKHLPDIPSAIEVGKEGIDVEAMQTALLKKIEELTLYTIELEKVNQLQQAQLKKIEDCRHDDQAKLEKMQEKIEQMYILIESQNKKGLRQ